MLMMIQVRNIFSILNNGSIPDLLSTAGSKYIVIMLIKKISNTSAIKFKTLYTTSSRWNYLI